MNEPLDADRVDTVDQPDDSPAIIADVEDDAGLSDDLPAETPRELVEAHPDEGDPGVARVDGQDGPGVAEAGA
jgi:hypothetical protein